LRDTAAARIAASLPLILVSSAGQARIGPPLGHVPDDWLASDMAWGVLLLILVPGVIGASLGARREDWGGLAGFGAGTVAGFALLLLGVVAVAALY
jgi:hypothetical protein